MKTVYVIYATCFNIAAIQHNQTTLEEMFNHQIHVENFYYDQMQDDDLLVADAYLLSNERLLASMRTHIADFKRVIIMERTLQKQNIPHILDIPAGTDVLLVNDTTYTSVHTVYMLYSLGISHLNLIPYDTEMESSGLYRHIQYAITPGEGWRVPKYISHVVDCLYRVISFKTLLGISRILDLNSDEIHRNLVHHLHSLAEVDADFHNKYLDSHLKSQMLSQVVQDSDHAIILVNDSYQLVYSNKLAHDLLHLAEAGTLSASTEELLRTQLSDSLVTLNDEHFVFEKSPLMLMDQLMGYCITLQSENTLQKIEYSLNSHLRQKGLYARHHFTDIIYQSSVMHESIELAKRAAATDYTILIRGESGSGKEVFAQSIHNYSERKNSPFVAINCAALPESLLESQLFGYEGGAFTGAKKGGKAGLFEQAHHGTIFLDEIGDISPNLQSRLLRVLQEKQIMRIGSDKIININVRIIAATNRNLEDLISSGAFRQDLYFRLSVIPIEIQPLRNRRDDILPLLSHFLGEQYNEITPAQKELLLSFDWPGNVRQLENLAAYYKALHQLPDYLVRSEAAGSGQTGTLPQPSPQPSSQPPVSAFSGAPLATRVSVQQMQQTLEETILRILYYTTEPLHGIGREALLAELNARGLSVSSNRLRALLSGLAEKGYVTVKRGRAGCQITEAGIRYLDAAAPLNTTKELPR